MNDLILAPRKSPSRKKRLTSLLDHNILKKMQLARVAWIHEYIKDQQTIFPLYC